MNEDVYAYKGFDLSNISKKQKLQNEYFNPYGYNIYSDARSVKDKEYNITHTNQDNKTK